MNAVPGTNDTSPPSEKTAQLPPTSWALAPQYSPLEWSTPLPFLHVNDDVQGAPAIFNLSSRLDIASSV